MDLRDLVPGGSHRDAVAVGFAYAVVANFLIGTVVAVAVLRFLIREAGVVWQTAGFGRGLAPHWPGPRSVVDSLSSENAARLAAMEAAHEGVSEKLEKLRRDAHQARQSQITLELLDLVTGAEAQAHPR